MPYTLAARVNKGMRMNILFSLESKETTQSVYWEGSSCIECKSLDCICYYISVVLSASTLDFECSTLVQCRQDSDLMISPIFAKEESGIFYHVVSHLEPFVFNYNVLEKPSLPTRTNISTLSGSRVHA